VKNRVPEVRLCSSVELRGLVKFDHNSLIETEMPKGELRDRMGPDAVADARTDNIRARYILAEDNLRKWFWDCRPRFVRDFGPIAKKGLEKTVEWHLAGGER